MLTYIRTDEPDLALKILSPKPQQPDIRSVNGWSQKEQSPAELAEVDKRFFRLT